MALTDTQKRKVNPEAFKPDYWKQFAKIYWPDLKSCQRGIAECRSSLKRAKGDKEVIQAKLIAITELKTRYLLDDCIKKNLSNREIAKILNCSESTISRAIKKIGLTDTRGNRAGRKSLIKC